MKMWKKVLAVMLAAALFTGTASACKNKSKTKSESSAVDADDISDANYVGLQKGFTDIKVTDNESAIRAVESVSGDLGLNDSSQLKVADATTFDGETYYRLQQYYKGAPIYGRDVVLVAAADGTALSLSSNMAKIEGEAAETKNPEDIDFVKLLEKIEGILQNDKTKFLDFKCTAEPEAVYYSADGASVRPCFKEVVSFKDANEKSYAFQILFDCETYEIVSVDTLQFYAGRSVSASGKDKDGEKHDFTAYRENGTYYMYDEDKNIAVYNAQNNTVQLYEVVVDGDDNMYYYNNGDLYDMDDNPVFFNDDRTELVDENGKTVGRNLTYELAYSASPNPDDLVLSQSDSAEWNDAEAVTAVSRVQNAYDFYKNILGRESYNNKGGAIRVFYNDALDGDSGNAYSCDMPDMTALSFGADNNIAYDVVGHEFTHSVVGSIVNLPYRNQSGAINEAYADIFGEIIEDYTDGKLDNSCNWITDTYRNQIDPESDGNPVQYRGKNWAPNISVPSILKNTPLAIIDLITDNGGVHTNSTVLSHAAYLMNNGIDGDASKKIDTELLAKIWYKAMFSLHTNETFKQCAQHVYEAAQRTEGVSNEQLECIKEAFSQANLQVK